MDDARFDQLTKAVASGIPRRRVLGGLGAVLIGVLGTSWRGASAAPANVTICHQEGTTGRWHRITVADSAVAAHVQHGDFPAVDCCDDAECTGTPAHGSPYCNQGICAVACDEGYALNADGECVVPCPETCSLGASTDRPDSLITDGPCNCGGVCCASGCFCGLAASGLGPTCFGPVETPPVIECYEDPTNPDICPPGSTCEDTECFPFCPGIYPAP